MQQGDTLMSSSTCKKAQTHVVIFPFMSKGHTIPLLHLARLLLDRVAHVTIFTTPANRPFISGFLPGPHVSIHALPFPDNIPGVPPGAESTDKLPSMSLFVPFVNGIKKMQPLFEEAIEKIHSQVSCIISDAFLPWTLQSASRFGIPRLSFHGMGYYSTAVSTDAVVNGLLSSHDSNDEPFNLIDLPWIKLTRNHFGDPFDKRDPTGPHLDSVFEAVQSTRISHGLLMNTFYELEQTFADYVTGRGNHCKYWSIGPLCLAQPQKTEEPSIHKPKWMHWLDEKSDRGCPVLYIAFGSQAKLSPSQLREIVVGLHEARVSYLWVVKETELTETDDAFGDRISERGMIVNEWVDQREILQHPAVQGFLSHCGWNSVLEGICAQVPILAWPMLAEQFLNGKMVEEEIKVGLRVCTVDGTVKGFVSGMGLKDAIVELMEGEKGRALREKVKEVGAAARKAMEVGGSSWNNLNELIADVQEQKKMNTSQLKLSKQN